MSRGVASADDGVAQGLATLVIAIERGHDRRQPSDAARTPIKET